jgi:hypothetical protein
VIYRPVDFEGKIMTPIEIDEGLVIIPDGWHQVNEGTIHGGDRCMIQSYKGSVFWDGARAMDVGWSIDNFECVIRRDEDKQG